jgi:hypothetical protein
VAHVDGVHEPLGLHVVERELVADGRIALATERSKFFLNFINVCTQENAAGWEEDPVQG